MCLGWILFIVAVVVACAEFVLLWLGGAKRASLENDFFDSRQQLGMEKTARLKAEEKLTNLESWAKRDIADWKNKYETVKTQYDALVLKIERKASGERKTKQKE